VSWVCEFLWFAAPELQALWSQAARKDKVSVVDGAGPHKCAFKDMRSCPVFSSCSAYCLFPAVLVLFLPFSNGFMCQQFPFHLQNRHEVVLLHSSKQPLGEEARRGTCVMCINMVSTTAHGSLLIMESFKALSASLLKWDFAVLKVTWN
jgi:hypothetical protein